MQLPTHFITGVMIDKFTRKSKLPEPVRLVVLAGACYLSHGILDKIARATYHPPDPLDDRSGSYIIGISCQPLPGRWSEIMDKNIGSPCCVLHYLTWIG